MIQNLLKNRHLFFYVLIGSSIINGFFVFYPITDGDIFWHLAAGREIISKRDFLYYDPFSFIPLNSVWIDIHWLFQIIMYLIERFGGIWALIFCKSFIIALSSFFIVLPFKNNFSNVIITFLFANLIFFQRYLIPLRPIIFSIFLISIFIFSYEKYLATHKKVYFLIISLSQLIWANSQGLFMLGPLIAFCYGFGELLNRVFALRLKKRLFFYSDLHKIDFLFLLIFPLIQIFISLFNPYHIKIFSLSSRLFSQINPLEKNIFSNFVAENIPLVKMLDTKYFPYAYITLFTFSLFIISLLCAGSNIRFSHTLLALVGFTSALMAQRNGILFTFLSLPALLWNFSESIFQQPMRWWKPISKVVIEVLLLSLIFGLLLHVKLFFLWQKPLSPFSHPIESVRYLQHNKLCVSPLFNADRYGGYIIWKLYPSLKVSYDTRWSMRDKSYFKEYIEAIKSYENFEHFCQKKGFISVLLPVAPADDYLMLAGRLYHSSQWKLIYTNGIEALFVRDSCKTFEKIDLHSSVTVDSIAKELFHCFGKNRQIYKEALTYLNRFCVVCNTSEDSNSQ
ncbi:MAG: hypothetical protein N2053_03045 [Chitinispirillaceae bacterium]|nr:hypothetical protein [Chitinispirillaceae bacterium]